MRPPLLARGTRSAARSYSTAAAAPSAHATTFAMDLLNVNDDAERPLLGVVYEDDADCVGVRSQGRWRLALAVLATFVPLLLLAQLMGGLSATPASHSRISSALPGFFSHLRIPPRGRATKQRFARAVHLRAISTCLRREFGGAGTDRVNIGAGLGALRRDATVLVAAVDERSQGIARWLRRRRAQGVPFVLFVAREPKSEVRVRALLAVRTCLQNATYLVYADSDIMVDFGAVQRVARSWTGGRRPLAVLQMDPGFLVMNARQRDIKRMLHAWLQSEKRGSRRTALADVCKKNSWFRSRVHALTPAEAARIILKN